MLYEGTGDSRHQLTTLLFLLRYADSDNTRNWTRTMLAQSYEQTGNYGQAIAFLKTTQPIDKAWLARLQQAQAKKNPPSSPKVNGPAPALPKATAPKELHS